MQQHLVASAPNIDARVQKARTAKRPGTSGRLHRNEVGEWVWSSDEDEGDSGKFYGKFLVWDCVNINI